MSVGKIQTLSRRDGFSPCTAGTDFSNMARVRISRISKISWISGISKISKISWIPGISRISRISWISRISRIS